MAYRLFLHEKPDWRAMMAPHRHCDEARMRPFPVVRCLADTTELDFNGQAQRNFAMTKMAACYNLKRLGDFQKAGIEAF